MARTRFTKGACVSTFHFTLNRPARDSAGLWKDFDYDDYGGNQTSAHAPHAAPHAAPPREPQNLAAAGPAWPRRAITDQTGCLYSEEPHTFLVLVTALGAAAADSTLL